ncbi:chorismate mutase [Skermania sp. ID1734]|nr:chorismate mutase [Skermania sp. ID1734]
MTKNGSASESAQAPAQATEDAALPNSEAEIEKLRKEIDRLDAEILAAIKRRTEISRIIGRTRLASGGTRLVHSREMKVLERFSELGQEGHTLAMLLLRLGRGRLGH